MNDETGDSWAPHEFHAMPVQHPPSPWSRFVERDETYLNHLGFSDGCSHCQVVSDRGVSVYSLPSLVLVHNEPEYDIGIAFPNLMMDGVGPIAGQRLRFAGRFGGGFSYRNGDDLLCEPLHLTGTRVAVFIKSNSAPFDLSANLLANPYSKIFDGDPVIAVGFCPCDNHLVIATSRRLRISTRQPNA
ncbi:hypothetical protein [Novipirellula caenicola]|uniref:Uncharacterized protein n=1 Tax=Novipirellula caenicola TaxID=1536901 RepID=A0ABP9VVQ3_9BACT